MKNKTNLNNTSKMVVLSPKDRDLLHRIMVNSYLILIIASSILGLLFAK